MTADPSARIDHHFASITDLRRVKVTFPLINIWTIALCDTVVGADELVAMSNWVRLHKGWLAQFLDLSAGSPSHDRLNRIFRQPNPDEFERCFRS